MFAFVKAPLITVAPRDGAFNDDRLPPKLPIGVLTAETITTSFIGLSLLFLEFFCSANLIFVNSDKSDNEDLSNEFMKFILTEEFQNIIPLNNWSFPVKLPKENWPIEFQNLPKPQNSIYLDEKKSSEIKSTAIEEWLEAMSK